MVDLALVLALSGLGALLGLPAARLLPARFAWRAAAAPALGVGLAAAVVSAGYARGVPVRASAAVLAVLALASAAIHGWRALAAWRADPGAVRAAARGAAPVAGAWAVAVLLLLAPRWVGGDQFAVFQGNQEDGFAYLQAAAVFASEPHAAVASAGPAEVRRNVMRSHARSALQTRPAVMQLYAAASRLAPREAWHLHYAYLVALLGLAVPAALFALRGWLPRAGPIPLAAAALAFPVGFWGQWVFDINAWSQLSTIALLLVVVALLVDAAAAPEGERTAGEGLRIAAVLAVAAAGAIFLYPEALAYHLVVLVPSAAAAVAWRARRGEVRLAAGLVPLAGVAGVAAGALDFPATLGFALKQFATSQAQPPSWWQYYQAFFAGRDGWEGHVVERGSDLVAGLYGLYFATPTAGAGSGVALLARLAVVAVAGGATAAVALLARRAAPGPGGEGSSLRVGAAAAVLLLVPAAYLALRVQYWAAGKAVGFVAPVFMAVLALPLASAARGWGAWARRASVALVAFQLACGAARVAAVAGTPDAYYAPPYPATMWTSKRQIRKAIAWELAPLERGLAGVRRVAIAPMNGYSETWAMLFLAAHGVEWAPLGRVNTYYGFGEDLGASPLPWEPDAMLHLTREGWALRFRDGRPPALAPLPRVR